MLGPRTGICTSLLLCLCAEGAVIRHRRQPPAVQITWLTEYVTAIDEVTSLESFTVEEPSTPPANSTDNGFGYPFLVVPPSNDNYTNTSDTDDPASDIITSFISKTFTETLYDGPKTVTVSIPPTTVTDVVTVSTALPTNFWSSPTHFTDLDPFKITHFADGASNVQLTDDVTADAKPDFENKTSVITSILDPLLPPLNTSLGSVVQVFYPAGSVNPGNDPVGGADFYASPLNLDDAKSVTLEYSVFFPSGFQWVKGGKLPGLYGGHMTCSGGDDATTCFSTRLMWREDGAGELYLYAPKDEQTEALCKTPPFSYCDEDYGLSIGRGSFNFTPGGWTTLRQTVTLNTPGQQDGGFLLEVDGRLAIHRDDVFYRALPTPSSSTTSESSSSTDATSSTDSGLLAPLLGDVLRRIGLDNEAIPAVTTPSADGNSTPYQVSSPPITTVTETADEPEITVTSYLFEKAKEQSAVSMNLQATQSAASNAVGFSGLFFSTFFGGSSKDYATPVDQFVWFKDFNMVVNF